MKRRPLPIVVALSVATALLLTGCGSGNDKSGDKDEIAGADTAADAKDASSSPSVDATDTAERPTITLPSDDQLVFKPAEVGDAKKDAVLRDNAELVRAIDAAIIKGDTKYAPVYFYSSGDAATSAAKSIQSYLDDGLSVTGKVTYFDRNVTFRKDGSARLTYCGDESEGFAKERKTGKVLKTPADKTAYIFYDTRFDLNDKGVWQMTAVVSNRGADQCQPS